MAGKDGRGHGKSKGERVSAEKSSRGNPSLGDMIRSIVVLGLIVGALFAVGLLFRSTPDSPVEPVDYAATVAEVRDTVDYPVLAPSHLPEGWRATSARFKPGEDQAWHLGVLTDDDEYLGLEQATVAETTLVKKFAEDSTPSGKMRVNGEQWQLREGGDRIVAVRESDGASTLVIGSVDAQVLRSYVSSLSDGSDDERGSSGSASSDA